MRGRSFGLLGAVGLASSACLAGACNAIFDIQSSVYREAGAADTGRDATKEASARDAGRDAAVDARRDTGVDAKRDTGLDSGRDSGADVPACSAPDAMPEGGAPSDPGQVVCNTFLPKDDGGTCATLRGSFCCNVTNNMDAGPDAALTTQCEHKSAANVSACVGTQSPVLCDETADCADGGICCASPTYKGTLGEFVQVCARPGPTGGCDLLANGGFPVTESGFQLCKRNGECGACGACSVFCCEANSAGQGQEIEACSSPSLAFCTLGPCPTPSSEDGFQDGTETDVDCGGGYFADASRDPEAGPSPPCGSGYKCRLNVDCHSDKCAPVDGGVMRCL